jgi:sodium transport system permease protein
MMGRIWTVFAKEVTDNVRDRRSLGASLFYPLLGPVLIALMFAVLGQTVLQQSERPLSLAVAGAENAPGLIQFLQQNDVEIRPAPANPEAEVRAGNYGVILLIPASYGEDLRADRPATVQLVADRSRQSASVTVSRARSLLEAYSRQIGSLRLRARGVNPVVVEALAIERIDVSTPESQAAGLLNITPYFIVFSIFIGGMYLAIDTTSGERERGSLEPLLINPVARWELVLGKLGAALVFIVIAVVETLIGFAVVLNFLQSSFGARLELHLLTLVCVFLIALPIMPLAAALEVTIATFTRSVKEAQNYISFLTIIPALPGMFLALVPVKTELWAMLVPTFGQQLLINQVLRGELVRPLNVIVSAVVTLLAGLVFVSVAAKLYEREQVLFGR